MADSKIDILTKVEGDIRRECLGKGYVELVDVSPRLVHSTAEEAIVRAARVSYANDNKKTTPASDAGLIRYLVENKHTSPLEMVEFSFKVCVPLAIATQILRHRTASVNAMSHRYTNADSIFGSDDQKSWYTPFTNPEDVRLQCDLNRQSSNLAGDSDPEKVNKILEVFSQMDSLTEDLHKLYREAIDLGAARESARFYLPTGTFTMLYWKMDLHNLLHFIRLRIADDAQKEVRVYAEAMLSLIRPLVPNVVKAFEDTYMTAVTFTASDIELMDVMRNGPKKVDGVFSMSVPSARRVKELRKKMRAVGMPNADKAEASMTYQLNQSQG